MRKIYFFSDKKQKLPFWFPCKLVYSISLFLLLCQLLFKAHRVQRNAACLRSSSDRLRLRSFVVRVLELYPPIRSESQNGVKSVVDQSLSRKGKKYPFKSWLVRIFIFILFSGLMIGGIIRTWSINNFEIPKKVNHCGCLSTLEGTTAKYLGFNYLKLDIIHVTVGKDKMKELWRVLCNSDGVCPKNLSKILHITLQNNLKLWYLTWPPLKGRIT